MGKKAKKATPQVGVKPKSLGLFANFVKADREDRRARGDQDVGDDIP